MNEKNPEKYELAVVGSGTTGMAASAFAANRGVKTVQIGDTSELNYATGLIDLLGVDPANPGFVTSNPWDAFESLKKVLIGHPYAKLTRETVEKAFGEFTEFLKDAGLKYVVDPGKNQQVVTPVGSLKTTYAVPVGMHAGAQGLAQKKKGVIVEIKGMKGFSSVQIKETLKDAWPDLGTAQVVFPGMESHGEVNAEHMARFLDLPQNRIEFADRLKPLAEGAEVMGLPAVLGTINCDEAIRHLSSLVGIPVFEIPTFSPSIPGVRLRENIGLALQKKGVKQMLCSKVTKVVKREDGLYALTISTGVRSVEILAENLMLCTGRFIGKGLAGDSECKIHESLMDLPISQPEKRSDWFKRDFFDREGHAVNQAGVRTDVEFRPVDKECRVIHENLFAAGSLLAGNDWKRLKCGSGVAVSTAFEAVNSVMKHIHR